MPKAYWVTIYREISDPDRLAAYARLAPVATAPFGCRYLARGLPDEVMESGLKERIVISEYPSLEKARAASASPAYREALTVLGNAAARDIRIIEASE